jgi:hypothetical protein
LRGWFACDVMTSLPLDRLLCMTAADGEEYIRFVKLLRWIKVRGITPQQWPLRFRSVDESCVRTRLSNFYRRVDFVT